MASTVVSSRGQIVIPRDVRDRLKLEPGARLEIAETADGLLLTPAKPGRRRAPISSWRDWRGRLKGTRALEEHVAEHRREAKR
jgi:AbrB family looped-hinge helix DNA binding protein